MLLLEKLLVELKLVLLVAILVVLCLDWLTLRRAGSSPLSASGLARILLWSRFVRGRDRGIPVGSGGCDARSVASLAEFLDVLAEKRMVNMMLSKQISNKENANKNEMSRKWKRKLNKTEWKQYLIAS